jgi:hypothetical protein
MDPDAALRMIDDADRVDAETRDVMRGLHQWLSRGGFAPDRDAYPTGTRRYRKAYGAPRGKTAKGRAHATIATAGHGGIQIGDIVQRSDIAGKNRYVVVNIQAPWIYTRRISGSGAPGIITFPSTHMLRKVG